MMLQALSNNWHFKRYVATNEWDESMYQPHPQKLGLRLLARILNQ